MTREHAHADTRVTDAILIHILNLPISSLSAGIYSKYPRYEYAAVFKPPAESEKLKVRKWTRLFIRNRGCRRRLDPESDKVSYSDTYDKDTSLMSRVIADMSLCGRHLSLHTNKWVSFSQLLSLTNNCPLVLRPSCSEWNSSDQISTQKLPQRWWEQDIQVSIMYRNILVTFVLLFV